MGKIAWLVVSDLHLYYKNISSRIDYVGEMRGVREELVKTAVEYEQKGFEKVNMLLLGDVFHRSYQNTFLACYDNNFFVMWKSYFGDIFSVIGNHELSFYSSNPFFTLVSEIESEKVQSFEGSSWKPQGLLPIIRVVDKVEDGEVKFYFNHYGFPVVEPEGDGVHIGLFHQEIVDPKIVSEMERSWGGQVFAKSKDLDLFPVLKKYRYCFFGHMHKIFGCYLAGDTYLYYVASLGRTNSSEVNDDNLIRKIPIVETADGKFLQVSEKEIRLPSRKECLKEEVVAEAKEWYEQQKMKKVARNYNVFDDDPMEDLKKFFIEDSIAAKIVEDLESAEKDRLGSALDVQFNKIVGR